MRADTVIRAGRPADAPLLAALSTQVFLHTYATRGVSAAIAAHVLAEFTPAKLQAWLVSDTVAVLVAEKNAHLVGYARLALGAVCAVCAVPGAGTVELTTPMCKTTSLAAVSVRPCSRRPWHWPCSARNSRCG